MIKIYKDKEGHLTIIFSGKNQPTSVTLVRDKGKNPGTNLFGGKVSRYTYHVADAYGDSGHSASTDTFDVRGEGVKRYKLVRSKQK